MMRKLRLTLVGTVTLALLWGLGGAVLAQDGEPVATEPVYSTSTFAFSDAAIGEATKVGDALVERGGWVAYTVTASDPRVSGDMVIGVSGSDYTRVWPTAEMRVFSAIARLDNADGAWEGPVRGIVHPTGFTSVGWLAGEEDYEGLTLFIRASGGAGGTAENLVYEGDPPPMPPAE